MNPALALSTAIQPALSFMAEPYNSEAAERMILAAWVQESGLEHRRQINGPARGFGQFEVAGCAEALRVNTEIIGRLLLPTNAMDLHRALEFSDIGCAVCSRLILWPIPEPLPGDHEEAVGWRQYLRAWRPGKPHHDRWNHSWLTAGRAVRACREGWW